MMQLIVYVTFAILPVITLLYFQIKFLPYHEGVKVVLRERNFRFALLSRSDLHSGDLAWADLRGAQMWKTLGKGSSKTPSFRALF